MSLSPRLCMQMTLSTPVFLCMPSKQLLHGNGKILLTHKLSTFDKNKNKNFIFQQTEVIRKENTNKLYDRFLFNLIA